MPASHYNRNIFFRGTIVVCLLVCALLWIPERFQNTSTEKEAVSAGADSTTAVSAKETTADVVPSKAKAKVEAKANVVQDKAEADVVPEVAKVEVKAKVVQDKAKADVVPEVAKVDVVVQSEAETVSTEVAEPVTPVEPIEDIEESEVIAGTTSTSTESASEAATDMTFAGEGSEAIFITRADSASVDTLGASVYTLGASAYTLCVRADTSSVRVDSVCVRMDTVRALPPVVALRTNLLYDAALIPNIGIEIWLGKQFTIGADWFGTWLSWDERHLYWQGYGGYLTLRYYFGKQAKAYRFVGHHAGIYGSALTYDVEFGGKGYQAAKFGFGGGLEYGYSLRLNRSLSFDFTLGVGYQGGEYKVYQPTNDGTGHYEWLATYKRHWIGPTKAEISLKWMIAPVGKKKGGER